MTESFTPPLVGAWPAPVCVQQKWTYGGGEPAPSFDPARVPLPFGRLRRERLIDDSVRACVDLSKVRLDKYGFLMVSGLDVEAVQAEYARRASL